MDRFDHEENSNGLIRSTGQGIKGDKSGILSSVKMKTVKLLNVSLILLLLSLIAAFSWTALGFKNEEAPFIAVLMIICFGLNVAGIFVGFYEERKSKKKFVYGVVGNSILVGLYVIFFIYVLTTL